jgi:hypothetical protein
MTRTRWSVVALFLSSHAILLLYSAHVHAVTVDEGQHLAAGVHDWDSGEFYLYRVNPPLVRVLATLPVVIAGAKAPDDFHDVPGVRLEFDYHTAFAKANADRYQDFVFLARLMGIVWSLVGGLLVFRWTLEVFGPNAATLSLAMWCFEPNIMAHAKLLTPDIPATVAGFGATYCFWKYLRRPSTKLACASGLLLGVALLTKLTMLALFGIWPVVWLAWNVGALRAPSTTTTRRNLLRTGAVHAVAITAIALVTVNAGYGFRGFAPRLGDLTFVSRTFGGEGAFVSTRNPVPTRPFADRWFQGIRLPLPADYVMGMDLQRLDFERPMKSYMAGRWRSHGWWYYYLYAIAVKVPLGFLALALWGIAFAVIGLLRRRDPVMSRNRIVLAVPAAALFILVSSQTGFSHHMRYVLPCFPFVMVMAGATIVQVVQRRPRVVRGLAISFTALGIISSLRVYPHSLSYFNEAAGGPVAGPRRLDNSNVDWGQDLLYLKAWLQQHPEARPLGLAYFGVVDPRILGIDFVLAPSVQGIVVPEAQASSFAHGPQPGYFAVSVNYLYGTTFVCFKQADAEATPCGGDDYEYFRMFEPIARLGYSIYVYHLSFEQANQLRYRLGYEPLPDALH